MHHSHDNLERRLSLVETHQKEMHELLSGMEHEAERLYNVSIVTDWAPWGDMGACWGLALAASSWASS